MLKKIDWWQPKITGAEYTLIKEVLESGYINEGEVTARFEKIAAELVGANYAVATTSGTAALFLSLAALEIGQEDEVIVPDITFIATANAVTLTGATPVLVDVDAETLLIDPHAISKAVTSRTRAIIPVHISGRPADLESISVIAQKYKLAIIEDAAEGFMSSYHDKHLGTYGDLGCLSFSPNKTITTGQGGMVLTNNKDLHKKLRMLKDQGRPVRGTGGDDIHHIVGYNFKLTNLQAAVGIGQLSALTKRIKRQKEIYGLYCELLGEVKQVKLFSIDLKAGEIPLWTDAIVENRDALVDYLKKHNIFCRKFWHPIHTQKPYRQANTLFPISTKYSQLAVWLPSAFTLSNKDILFVCKYIKKFYKHES